MALSKFENVSWKRSILNCHLSEINLNWDAKVHTAIKWSKTIELGLEYLFSLRSFHVWKFEFKFASCVKLVCITNFVTDQVSTMISIAIPSKWICWFAVSLSQSLPPKAPYAPKNQNSKRFFVRRDLGRWWKSAKIRNWVALLGRWPAPAKRSTVRWPAAAC